MKYFIQGEYPRYTITAYREQELVRVDHAADMRQVMLQFVHRLQPGDSIEWVGLNRRGHAWIGFDGNPRPVPWPAESVRRRSA